MPTQGERVLLGVVRQHRAPDQCAGVRFFETTAHSPRSLIPTWRAASIGPAALPLPPKPGRRRAYCARVAMRLLLCRWGSLTNGGALGDHVCTWQTRTCIVQTGGRVLTQAVLAGIEIPHRSSLLRC